MRDVEDYACPGFTGGMALADDFMLDILRLLASWGSRRELTKSEAALTETIVRALAARVDGDASG